VLVSHGKLDCIVRWERAKEMYQLLDDLVKTVQWEIIENLDHGFNKKSFDIFKNFYKVCSR